MKLQRLMEQRNTLDAAINAERQAQREQKKALVLKHAEKLGLFDLDPKQIADAMQKAASSVAASPSATSNFSSPTIETKEPDHASD